MKKKYQNPNIRPILFSDINIVLCLLKIARDLLVDDRIEFRDWRKGE